MKTTQEVEQILLQLKPELAKNFHVSKIGYFGSFSNQTQTEKSDLDLLVEFSQPIGWDFFLLEKHLEQAFGMSIDLVTPNALKERIKPTILKQVRYI